MTDKRKDCQMRHKNGNCTVVGGFCTSVNDPICEALHNAYDCGYRHSALREQEERENPTPLTLKDLMNMNGEPVWWWNKSCTPICMICVSDRFTDEPMFVNFDFKEEDCTGLTKYKWLMKRGYKPYRTNPKEESK